jgi:uncharacterized protein YndB with AHSA1/START domain
MTDILHDLPIAAPVARVYEAISTPAGLDRWWTASSAGEPKLGAEYRLGFGPEYDWRGIVRRSEPNHRFELELTQAMPDWLGTSVGFILDAVDGATQLHFSHSGWPAPSEHFRISSYCWAMYLRILRRSVEFGEAVPYERRLEV